MNPDRSKFRTCDQTSFCRRHRNGKSKQGFEYRLDPASIKFHPLNENVKEDSQTESDGTGNTNANANANTNTNTNTNNGDENDANTNTDATKSDKVNQEDQSYMQKIKTMLTGSPSTKDDRPKSKKVDPYFLGPKPFFTATLINDASMTFTGEPYERLLLAVHLHDDGVARIRITEEYNNGNVRDENNDMISEIEESSGEKGEDKAYQYARWTSDELILNHEEMKFASNIQAFETSTEGGNEFLRTLASNLNYEIRNDENNYVAFRYGDSAGTVSSDNGDLNESQDFKCTTGPSSIILIQFEPFQLHLWRDDDSKCSNKDKTAKDDQSLKGPPLISVNTDNLLHFEIRTFNKDPEMNTELDKDSSRDKDYVTENEDHQGEKIKGADSADGDVDDEEEDKEERQKEQEDDRHGGKEIVGYWEDGLAIYADGTREQRKENIIQEQRRKLADDVDDGIGDGDSVHFDRDGSWEEKFGDHLDTKPFGPMSVGADITFPSSKHLFGLPEHASSLQLKGTTGDNAHYKDPYRLYNLDVFEYELDETMALYGEVPLIVGQSKDSGTVGVFWFNPTETFVDVEASDASDGTKTHWMSESGIIDLFLLPGPNPKSLYRQYAKLTGRMPLPPMWSLGYHQCRWNYRDEEDVYQVHGKFEELDYPYDVLWLDIEHTDGKRYFTWDKNSFPNPIPMQEKLSAQGRNMVTIIDPHIKRDPNYHIHKEATAKGLYIKDKDGKKDYDGWCWPGSSSYLDFTNEKVRNWWADQFAYNKYVGSTSSLFTWNDMNEPSVFNGPEISMQKDLRNLDGVEHREWHNLYGLLFQRATAEGLTRRNTDENVRPFVLSRSFFAGSQRYGSIWTGDNESSWPHLKIAAPMLLSLNTAALSFVGADVGGFFGNPDAELMTRWMQAGAYQPFFRGHAHHDAKRREPWMFGDEWMVRMRRAAMTRYALLPYWYTVFREAGVTGMPVMRTMWMQYPELEGLYSVDDQYLIGSDILVKPVTDAGATETEVKFPTSHDWYDVDTMLRMSLPRENNTFETLSVSSDIDKIPVYQRGGSIIARKLRLRRSTRMMINDPYTLYIALDKESYSASGVLYMDDENSFDHEKKGHFCEAKFTADMNRSIKNKVEIGDKEWITEEMLKSRMIERIVIMGVETSPKEMHLGFGEVSFTYDESSHVVVVRKPNVSALGNWDISISM